MGVNVGMASEYMRSSYTYSNFSDVNFELHIMSVISLQRITLFNGYDAAYPFLFYGSLSKPFEEPDHPLDML